MVGLLTEIDGHWLAIKDGDPRARALYLRHYSARRPSWSRELSKGAPANISAPGRRMILLTAGSDALYVWRCELYRHDGQEGLNCAVFRNESPILSSELIREADTLAWAKWPDERHWTYVDPSKTRHKRDPGRCFRKAGWRPCGLSKGGLVILEVFPSWVE